MTQNGEKRDMESEDNRSKDDSRWEQSAMSEGAAYPHGMGTIYHIKPKGGKAQPQSEWNS